MIRSARQIPIKIFEEHYTQSAAELMESPAYDQLAAETAAIIRRPATQQAEEHPRAHTLPLMPIAYFGICASAAVMRDPALASQLPLEVMRRQVVLRDCSRIMVALAHDKGVFDRYYLTNPHLGPLYRSRESPLRPTIRGQSKGLAVLGGIAILDTAIVAGGGLRYLRRDQPQMLVADPAAAIIGRSTALQLITRIPDGQLSAMRKRLGVPYFARRHFQPGPGATLEYTPEVEAYIRSLFRPGRGCPAAGARMRDSDDYATFLQESWTDLVNVLLPQHAQASDVPNKAPHIRRGKKR